MNNYFFILIFSLFLFSCGSDKSENPPSETTPSPPIIINDSPASLTLTAMMNHLRLRDSAGKNGKIIDNLSSGETLIYNGEKSDFTTPEKLRGYPYNEPWLKVKTKTGKEGWVYGGGVKFGEEMENELVQELIDNRLEQLFGKKNYTELQSFQENYRRADSSMDLSKTYRQALTLRDNLVQILHDEIEVEDPQKAVSMDWLQESLPGFITQLVAEGTMYHLFFYYEDWAKKARRTDGKQDDDFFDLMYDVYPIDHIEHPFPGWFLQTWDYGGHSELGKGIHQGLLAKMNKLLAESDLFAPEIEGLKNDLINDITNAEVTYWYDKKAILAEINAILAANFGILTNADKIALETRKKHFQSPQENGIELDFRSGKHD